MKQYEKIYLVNPYNYDVNDKENTNYGIRIINYLKKLGGINASGFGGHLNNSGYFINQKGLIWHKPIKDIPKDYKYFDLDNPEINTTNNTHDHKDMFLKILDKIKTNNGYE